MKILLSLMLLCISIFALDPAKGEYVKELDNLSPEQEQVLRDSIAFGEKHNMGYLFAAISWKETNFGERSVNDTDGKYGSYGPYQILMDSALSRIDLPGATRQQKIHLIKWCLIHWHYFSATMAKKELDTWSKIHKGDLHKTLASYNVGGKSTSSPVGARYARDVIWRVKVLKAKLLAKN